MKDLCFLFGSVYTVVADELKDLNAQRTSIDEQRESIKRKKRDDLRAE